VLGSLNSIISYISISIVRWHGALIVRYVRFGMVV